MLIILHTFLLSAHFIEIRIFIFFAGIPSECQTVWTNIGTGLGPYCLERLQAGNKIGQWEVRHVIFLRTVLDFNLGTQQKIHQRYWETANTGLHFFVGTTYSHAQKLILNGPRHEKTCLQSDQCL